MTDQHSPPAVDPRHRLRARKDRPDLFRWRGWVAFGGIVMVVTGAFSVTQGVVVVLDVVVLSLVVTWSWAITERAAGGGAR